MPSACVTTPEPSSWPDTKPSHVLTEWALNVLPLTKGSKGNFVQRHSPSFTAKLQLSARWIKCPAMNKIIKVSLCLYSLATFPSLTAQNYHPLFVHKIKRKDTAMRPVNALQRNELLWDNSNISNPKRCDR